MLFPDPVLPKIPNFLPGSILKLMLFNVWGLIWPNQKRILGMVEATDEKIAKGKVIALMASRTNTLLSIPMLMCMSSHMHGLPL